MAPRKKKPARTRRARRHAPAAPGTSSALRRAKREIEAVLHTHVRKHHAGGPLKFAEEVDAEHRNIVGVAIGHAHAFMGTVNAHGAAPGDEVLVVLVAEKRSHAEIHALLREIVHAKAAIPPDLPIEVMVTGVVHAHAQTFQQRPAALGTSVGNCREVSGTFGFLGRGRTAPRDAKRFLVSNAHVLVNDNQPRPGDGICQPGPSDGGSCPAQQIAVLERAVPINFGGPNKVDVAAAVASPAMVRPEILFMKGGTPTFVKVGPGRPPAATGMLVGKSGRSTGVTMGRVLSTSATVVATYGVRTALFIDQILVAGLDGAFSDQGDSGALVWTWDPQRNPVGLLFGGGNGVSFVNHLDAVLDALDIDLA